MLAGLLLWPALSAAQSAPEAAPLPGVVRAIEVRRLNIFADSEATFLLPRLANRLHVRTRAQVVGRELLFRAGERYDSAAVAETARNLRRLGVFRLVRIDSATTDTGLVVRVTTQDGWSSKPEFGFRSAGGQVAWRASLVEENLLGTASALLLGYAKDPDRTTFVVGLRQPRLIANSVGLAFQYDDRSDGNLLYASLQRPFLSLADHYGWSAAVESRDERVLRYFEGARLPGDTVQRTFAAAGGGLGIALRSSSRSYHRVGIAGRIWEDEFRRADTVFGARRPTASVGAWWEFRHARYAVVRGFTTARDEDVDLSSTVRLGLSATPRWFGWDEFGVIPSVGARIGGVVAKRWFGYLDLNAHGRFTAAGLDTGAVQLAGTMLFSPQARHTVLLHGWGGMLEGPRPGGEFDLGLGVGPRGFQLHAFTGDRALIGTAEYRYIFAEDVLGVMDMGIAGFADYGGAWYAGAPRRTGWDYGAGIRLGVSRSTDLEMTRIDLVRRVRGPTDPGGWLVVIGRGLTFSRSGVLNR